MKNLYNQRGSTAIAMPIVIAFSIFMLAILVVIVINMIMPYIWYEKLSLESLKYIFVMEEYGYLTQEEKNNLLKELEEKNFDTTKIDITATAEPVEYGQTIFLNISYTYNYSTPILDKVALSASTTQTPLQMIVRRQSVSKR